MKSIFPPFLLVENLERCFFNPDFLEMQQISINRDAYMWIQLVERIFVTANQNWSYHSFMAWVIHTFPWHEFMLNILKKIEPKPIYSSTRKFLSNINIFKIYYIRCIPGFLSSLSRLYKEKKNQWFFVYFCDKMLHPISQV